MPFFEASSYVPGLWEIKKMVVVIADLAWLNGPNRTPGYVW